MQERITRRKAIAGIGGLTTTAVLAGCSTSEDDGDSASSDDGNGSDGNGSENSDGDGNGSEDGDGNGNGGGGSVEILEHEAQTAEFGDSINVVGEIQNNTGEEQSYIELTATFYDSEGTRVGDSMTNFSDVPDGETIAFEIMTTVGEGEYDNYELETSTSL